MAHERSIVVGVFANREQAYCAEQALRNIGFRDDQIGVAMRSDNTAPGTTEYNATTTESRGTHAAEGGVGGAVSGGIVGGLIGAAAAIFIPGVGPVVAGGILATALAGAATGAVAGGILGTLAGLGVPDDEAHFYNDEFNAGRIVMTARADGRYDQVHDIFRQCGAYDMHSQTTTGRTTYEDRSIRLHDSDTLHDQAGDLDLPNDDDVTDTRDTGRVF